MNERQVATHLQAIAEEAVPGPTDLWPAVAARVGTGRQPGGRRRARWRLLALAGTVVVLVALALGAVAPTAADAAASAANQVMTIIGLRASATAVTSPVCVSADKQTQPILQPVEAPTPPGGAPVGAVSGLRVSCPEGFELQTSPDRK